MNERQLYRMRAPASGREALAHAEPGQIYVDRETGEEMEPVAMVLPLAPMFAFNVSDEDTWRGSRLAGHCASKEDIQGGHPQQGVGKTKTYGCYYSNARLLYTATLVKRPTAEAI